MPRDKVYHFWNGKNIDGRSYVGWQELIEESPHSSNPAEMKYEVGCDTVSADDLQPGMDYTEG